ncbi:MAG: metallophosphoesterase [Ferruginibacter sp.]|nr:metallophosphoesterase [Ferruginibacter sp.]
MSAHILHRLLDNQFLLNIDRTIFWEEERSLILSDLHLGKSGHFRKSGIGIPQNIFKEDMQRLLAAIQFYKPQQLIIVGDLFHSHFNKEHDLFLRWRKDLAQLPIQLVKGNHDILKKEWYADAGINVHDESLVIGKFMFTHDIDTCPEHKGYCFSGHIHPGIRLRGLGRQSLQLPCFYFAKTYAVLPAFGKFTGTFPIRPLTGESVYALVDDAVLKM